jgi:hypothetical protein
MKKIKIYLSNTFGKKLTFYSLHYVNISSYHSPERLLVSNAPLFASNTSNHENKTYCSGDLLIRIKDRYALSLRAGRGQDPHG